MISVWDAPDAFNMILRVLPPKYNQEQGVKTYLKLMILQYILTNRKPNAIVHEADISVRHYEYTYA
jgi:hypothetical protein